VRPVSVSHHQQKGRIQSVDGSIAMPVKVILFDYGGVLAEEGFREGLMEIARSNGLSPQDFFEMATTAVYESGYVVGNANEHSYWDLLRKRSGVRQSDAELRKEILERFILRPWVLEIVRNFKREGYLVGILSDQTQWLDELDGRDHFFAEFDVVFNSYHLGRGKKDPQIFYEVAERLGVRPSEILFIDDNEGHIERARSRGLRTILFKGKDSFLREVDRFRQSQNRPVSPS
jgi:putative hydrolase of the HAD superfamily